MHSWHIDPVAHEHKGDHRDLLLLADENWEMVMRYLPSADVYVLREEGNPRALALVALLPTDDATLEVKALAVDPTRRRRGFGRAMLDFAADHARGKARRLLVGTGDSSATIPFYERCGFVRCGIIPHFFRDNYPDPIVEEGVLLDDMILLERLLC